jgi:hypothetical protein
MLRASYRAPLLHDHQLQISKRHLSGLSGKLVGALIHYARPRATPPLLLLLLTSLTSWAYLDLTQNDARGSYPFGPPMTWFLRGLALCSIEGKTI